MTNDPASIACWHTQTVIFGCTKLQTIYFTTPLRSPEASICLPVVWKGVVSGFLKMWKLPSITLAQNLMWLGHFNLYLDQTATSGWCEPTVHLVSYPFVSSIATRLGLCSSLSYQLRHISWWWGIIIPLGSVACYPHMTPTTVSVHQ